MENNDIFRALAILPLVLKELITIRVAIKIIAATTRYMASSIGDKL